MESPPDACLVSDSAAVHEAIRADKSRLLAAVWLLFMSNWEWENHFLIQIPTRLRVEYTAIEFIAFHSVFQF